MDVLHPDAGLLVDHFDHDVPSNEILHIAAEGHRLHQRPGETLQPEKMKKPVDVEEPDASSWEMVPFPK